MPKKTETEEVEEVVKDMTKKVNVFLADEKPDEDTLDGLEEVFDETSTVTKLLGALSELVGEDDQVGAALIAEFRVRYARHEMELG